MLLISDRGTLFHSSTYILNGSESIFNKALEFISDKTFSTSMLLTKNQSGFINQRVAISVQRARSVWNFLSKQSQLTFQNLSLLIWARSMYSMTETTQNTLSLAITTNLASIYPKFSLNFNDSTSLHFYYLYRNSTKKCKLLKNNIYVTINITIKS